MPAAPTCAPLAPSIRNRRAQETERALSLRSRAPRAIHQKQAAQGTESRLFQKPARLCRTGFYKQKKQARNHHSEPVFLQ